jgi:hypothetical protein
MSKKPPPKAEIDTAVRAGAFYDTIERERVSRGWRVRQFSDWLGIGDLVYRWRAKKPSPPKLPETETLIRIAVRLEWSLDRLLRGVSAAYDAQGSARTVNTGTGMEQQSETRTGDRIVGSEWARLHGAVVKPDAPTPETRDQRAALLELLTPEQWALVRTIVGIGPDEAIKARSLLRRWLGQLEPSADATTEPHRNQGGSAQTDRPRHDK